MIERYEKYGIFADEILVDVVEVGDPADLIMAIVKVMKKNGYEGYVGKVFVCPEGCCSKCLIYYYNGWGIFAPVVQFLGYGSLPIYEEKGYCPMYDLERIRRRKRRDWTLLRWYFEDY